MRLLSTLLLTGGLVIMSGVISAQANADSGLSVGAVMGSTGYGADISYRFNTYLGVTGRYTEGLSFSTDYEDSDVFYEGDFDASASSIKLDVYPFGGNFFISAGMMSGDVAAQVSGVPNDGGQYTFGNTVYDSSAIGTVEGAATLVDGQNGYVGIGWRSTGESGLSFFSEIGIVPTDVNVALSTSSGLESASPELNADLREEEETLKNDIEALEFYPVVTVGLSYAF